MKSTFKRNIQIGFGLSLLVLIISSVASYISITSLLNSSKLVNQTTEVIQELNDLMLTMKDAETAQRGYLLSGDEDYLNRYNGVSERITAKLGHIRYLTSDDSFQQTNLSQLNTMLVKRIKFLQRLIDTKRSGQDINILYLQEGNDVMEDVRIMVQTMQTHESNLLTDQTAAMNRFASYTPILIIIAAVFSLLSTIFFYIKVTKDFAEKSKLQAALEIKEEGISKRIAVIQSIAEKISLGDYKIRIDDEA